MKNRSVANKSRKRNTFTSLGADHAARRKVVNGIYGKSYLQRSRHVQAIIAELINGRLLPVVREAIVSGSPIDILETSISYGVDFLTAFEFGLPRSTDFLRKASSRKSWLDLHRRAHPLEYMFWFLEHWHLTNLLVKVGLNVVPKAYFQADADYDAWATELVEKTEYALQVGSSEEATPSGDWPIEYYQLRKAMAQERDPSEDGLFTPTEKQQFELASECLDHISRLISFVSNTANYFRRHEGHYPYGSTFGFLLSVETFRCTDTSSC